MACPALPHIEALQGPCSCTHFQWRGPHTPPPTCLALRGGRTLVHLPTCWAREHTHIPPPPPFPRPAQGGCQRALAPTCFAPRNGHYLAPREGPCPCVPFPTQGPYTHTPSCYAPHGQGPARPLAPLASPPHTYLHEAKTQQNILVHSNAIWDGTRCVPSMLNVRNIWHGIYGHSMLLNGL